MKGCGKELGNCKCGEPCGVCNGEVHFCDGCEGVKMESEIKTTEEIYEDLCDNTGCGYHEESDVEWIRIKDVIETIDRVDDLHIGKALTEKRDKEYVNGWVEACEKIKSSLPSKENRTLPEHSK